MGLLRILGLRHILARRRWQIGFAKILENGVAGRSYSFRRDINTVGSHIGDKANRIPIDIHTLIKPLGHLHGLGRGETEFTRGFLLQG
jgi:hypothetical protein